MVTARSDTHDVVAGLEAGADDYVTKPFVAKELAARIRALLRRSRPDNGQDSVINFGDVQIEPDAGVVRRHGEEVHCTRTEFRLLCELADHPGKVLSREHLLEQVWGYDYFGDGRLVDVHVRRLRTKVEPDPANPRPSSRSGAWATSWRSDPCPGLIHRPRRTPTAPCPSAAIPWRWRARRGGAAGPGCRATSVCGPG